MSAPMKMPRTKGDIKVQIGDKKTRLFLVPRDRAEGVVRLLQDFEVKDKEESIPWRNAVTDLIEKYSEAGAALKGARAKEAISQSDLAEKLGIPQSHISDMEHGRRTIGKNMAKRLAKALNVGYKVFL